MSKSKSKSSLSNATKELQKKIDDLQTTIDSLRHENKDLKEKLKVVCKKIVDNTDLSEYSFINSSIEPYQIETNDLLHMVQKLALLASQINSDDNLENHVEALELRITELTNENSSFFKNKLKLQERLEFIMQERDVWKRNAETLKKMYAKLVKEKESEAHLKSNKCTIGTYRANLDQQNTNQRIYSAPIPKDYFDSVRNSNITSLQLEKLDHSISNQLTQLSSRPGKVNESEFTDKIYFLNDSNNNNVFNSIKINDSNNNNNSNNNLEGFISFPSLESLSYKKDLNSSESDKMSEHYSASDLTTNTDIMEQPVTNTSNQKKIVSFNNDIDVRIYRKNSKHSTKLVDSYLLPLSQILSNEKQEQKQADENNNKLISLRTEQIQTRSTSPDLAQSLKLNNQKQANILNSISINSSQETRFPNRGSVSSSKKFPGETPVKNLEPTLKMIIIKELSVEKLDGKDWRMFALRVGISENEIKEWISLKLQYPMARVLSFWSSRPEATIRILHRHLSAPCFNYGALAKRIENFYDVL